MYYIINKRWQKKLTFYEFEILVVPLVIRTLKHQSINGFLVIFGTLEVNTFPWYILPMFKMLIEQWIIYLSRISSNKFLYHWTYYLSKKVHFQYSQNFDETSGYQESATCPEIASMVFFGHLTSDCRSMESAIVIEIPSCKVFGLLGLPRFYKRIPITYRKKNITYNNLQ